MREVLAGLLIVCVIVVLAFSTGLLVDHFLLPHKANCVECHEVEEYYRGVYDLCMVFTDTDAEFCLGAIQRAYESGRHELPSPGFQWAEPEQPDDG